MTGNVTKTWCRMRGKDFCWKMIATEFNNLGKCLRSKLAVLSDMKSYTKNKKQKTSGEIELDMVTLNMDTSDGNGLAMGIQNTGLSEADSNKGDFISIVAE